MTSHENKLRERIDRYYYPNIVIRTIKHVKGRIERENLDSREFEDRDTALFSSMAFLHDAQFVR